MDTENHVALAEQRKPGQIERVEQDDGTVRYRNVMLLAPGVWGDAASQRQFLYSDETTRTLADNVLDTTLNLFHEQDNETTEVGELDESSVYVGEDDDALYGDLVLTMDNAASEFADEALQDALESEGEKGIKGPSLEIGQPEHEFNADAGVPEVTDGVITGVGLVGLGVSLGPGSKDVAFEEQTRQRAVALASADSASVLTRNDDMTNDINEEAVRQLLSEIDPEDIQDLADDYGIELQTDSEMGMVADLIEQAASEGFDPSDQSVDELRAFIGENLDPSEDAMAAFDDIADAVLETEEADSEDVVSAEAMADWIAEQMGDEADEGGEDENAGDKDDDEMEMADELEAIKEQVAANAERIDTLAEAQEGIDLADLASKADAVEAKADAETVTELAETVETISENLQEQTSLAAAPGAETDGSDAEDRGVFVDFGSADANPNREY